MGTAASLRGVATVLKRHEPGIRIVAVTLMADSGLKYMGTDVYRKR